MYGAGNIRRTFTVFVLLAVAKSPSATLNTVIISGTGVVTSPVSMTYTRVPVIAGGDAEMPCDTRPAVRNDTVLLVVWYRDDSPVYSYDSRKSGPSAHWMEDQYLGRTHWHNTPTSGLRMKNVQPGDRDDYRCRVDFRVSQTRNYKVALDVIELPEKPVIFDEFGKEIIGIAGPYHEGRELKLICTVKGGYPVPRIQWVQGDAVLENLRAPDYYTEHFQPSRSLTLTIDKATRSHLGATYICATNNTVLSPPLKTAVQIDLYLKPVTVSIVTKEQPLSVGMKAEILCKTKGARPPAILSWLIGGKKLDAITKTSVSKDENETESLLQWSPVKEHNGQILACRAEHPQFNRSSIESKLHLNVYYMPEVTIHLGAKVNPNDIEEGDDVYFGCKVDANPPAYKVTWEHNGVVLQNNPSSGVIITGNTNLALRNISRMQVGHYTCIASNVEGDGRAPYLQMQVVYRPMCIKREMKIIGAALQEVTTVTCEVDAYPPPETFEWILNNSAGSHIVEAENFTVDAKAGRSRLSFKASSDVDYGTLSCRATNLAGQQVKPCVYTLLPATIPESPRNCTVYNLTDDALDLMCLSGYEGGLPCAYIVEVWADDKLLGNSSNHTPSWSFRRLGSNRQYHLMIYTANGRGKSDYVMLTVETTLRLSSRTKPEDTWELNWEITVFFGAVITVLILLCLGVGAIRIRQRSRDYEGTLPPLKNQKFTVQKRGSLQSLDDKNPDLIPFSKGVLEAPVAPPQYSAVDDSAQAMDSSSMHSMTRSQDPIVPVILQADYSDFQSDFGRTVMRAHREIVTTRTPLLAGQQESCV